MLNQIVGSLLGIGFAVLVMMAITHGWRWMVNNSNRPEFVAERERIRNEEKQAQKADALRVWGDKYLSQLIQEEVVRFVDNPNNLPGIYRMLQNTVLKDLVSWRNKYSDLPCNAVLPAELALTAIDIMMARRGKLSAGRANNGWGGREVVYIKPPGRGKKISIPKAAPQDSDKCVRNEDYIVWFKEFARQNGIHVEFIKHRPDAANFAADPNLLNTWYRYYAVGSYGHSRHIQYDERQARELAKTNKQILDSDFSHYQ